jgi:hypothetical protein
MRPFRIVVLFIVCVSILVSCRSQETSTVHGAAAAPASASSPAAAAGEAETCFPPEAVDHLAMTVEVDRPIGVLTRAVGQVHRVVAIDEHLKSPDVAISDLGR